MENLLHYLIQTDQIDTSRILDTWLWLIKEGKTIVALTKMGDALLRDGSNNLYHLDTGLGEINLINDAYWKFLNGALEQEVYEEILLPEIVDLLEADNRNLNPNQIYSFYKLPIIGGNYEANNIYCLDMYEHFGLTGEIHSQLSGLQDGIQVVLKTD